MAEAPEGGSPLSKIPKPVLYIGGVAVAFFGYRWYKARQASKSQADQSAQTPISTPYGQPATGTGVLQPIIINQPGNPPTPAPASVPAPPSSNGAFIAGKGAAHDPMTSAWRNWAAEHGIPIFSIPIYENPRGGPPINSISYGSIVRPSGTPKGGFGGTLFYPVQGGWVSALDLGLLPRMPSPLPGFSTNNPVQSNVTPQPQVV